MSKPLEFCTELHWPSYEESLRAALRENPGNVYAGPSQPLLAAALTQIDKPYIGVLFEKAWAPGRLLRISFLGQVDPKVRARITEVARQWLVHVNLRFEFISGADGEIRITTDPGGSWSYIGTDALLVKPGQATMNFGWLTPDGPDDEYRRVVLHEFGHAFGAIHEHQLPDAGIPWDRPAVYAYYAQMGWSKEQVDHNVFAKYSRAQLNSSSYDRLSIMHYAIPNELTVGDWEVGWNKQLSSTDQQFMRKQYP
jgi:serralysin